MTRARVALCVLACTGALAAGCGPTSAARKAFSEAYFCPTDWITVAPHAGSAADAPARPPAELANDPERVELWKKKQQRDAQESDGKRLVDADGCGHRRTYACYDITDFGNWTCTAQLEQHASSTPVADLPLPPPPPPPPPPLPSLPSLLSPLPEAPASADAKTILAQLEQMRQFLKVAEANPRLADKVPALRARLDQVEESLKLVQKLHPMHLGITLEDRPGQGVAVQSVTPGSHAEGKLRAGDLIVEAQDMPVRGLVDLLRAEAAHPDDPLRVRVERGDETVSVTVEQGLP